MAGNALPEIDFELLDVGAFFSGGDFKIEFAGFAIQQQQGTRLGIHHPRGGFDNQFKQLIQILNRGNPGWNFLQAINGGIGGYRNVMHFDTLSLRLLQVNNKDPVQGSRSKSSCIGIWCCVPGFFTMRNGFRKIQDSTSYFHNCLHVITKYTKLSTFLH